MLKRVKTVSLVTPTDDEQFDAFCQQVTTSIAESYGLDPEDLTVNVGTPGHCDYRGESVVETALKQLEIIDKMDKRKILVICAGMGLVDTGFHDMITELQTYDIDPKPLALDLAATERRYWPLPRNAPKPKAVNAPYYRRYEKRPHR